MNVLHEDLDETSLVALAQRLAPATRAGLVIHLLGNLGAGKTTFARALLQAIGVGERVKSPTYSLIESYRTQGRAAHHLDLYRLADPEEMEWLGLPDLAEADALILIEWPDRGAARIPAADLVIELRHRGDSRDLQFTALTPRGVNASKLVNLS